MSFGYSIGDGILLVQLAWKTLQGARQACGEYGELTREVASLHRVLRRLQKELSNPDSLLNRADDDRRQDLNEHGRGCVQILTVMNSIVTKYNKLSESGSAKRIWQKVKFGNGEMKDLSEIRLKLSAHTSAIIMRLNLCSLGSQGRVEKQLNEVGGDLEGIRGKVDWIAANMTARTGDGTVWTSYENDDRSFWRQLRRELVKEGYHSSVLHKHKGLLKDYVEELGRRGVFDQIDSGEDEELEEDEISEEYEESKADEEQEAEVLQDDAQENIGSEDEKSDIVELEGSEPEEFEQLGLSDGPEQPAQRIGSEHPDADQLSLHATLVQSPDTGVLETSVPPISLIEPSPELPSPADELQSDAVVSLSQTQIMAVLVNESVITPPMLGRSVHMEDVLDEDFVPGAHPNCFTDKTLETPRENIQNISSHVSVTSQTSPDIMNSRAHQERDILSENTTKDFILLSTVPSEISSTPVTDESIELSTDSKTLKQKVKKRQKSGKEAEVLLDVMRITLKDPAGRTWKLPFSRIKACALSKRIRIDYLPNSQHDVQDVEELISQAFEPGVRITSMSGPHSHFGPDGTLTLPENWHDLVGPGWSVSLQRRRQPRTLDEQPQSPSSADRDERRYAITDLPLPLPPAPNVFNSPSAAVPNSHGHPYNDNPYQSAHQSAQGRAKAKRSTYEAWENMKGANVAVLGVPTTWNPPKLRLRDIPKELAYRAEYGDSDDDEYEDVYPVTQAEWDREREREIGGAAPRAPMRLLRTYTITRERYRDELEAKSAAHWEEKSQDKERRYRSDEQRSKQAKTADIAVQAARAKAARSSPPLRRAQTFQAGDRGPVGGGRLKRIVEYASDDSDNDSSNRTAEHTDTEATRAKATRASPSPLPTAQTFLAGERETGWGSLLKKSVEYSSDDSDSNSSMRNSYHRINSSTPIFGRAHHKGPYIVEPRSPSPTTKKTTLKSYSSATPINPASLQTDPPTRSKTQDYSRPNNSERSKAKESGRKEKRTRSDGKAPSSDRLPPESIEETLSKHMQAPIELVDRDDSPAAERPRHRRRHRPKISPKEMAERQRRERIDEEIARRMQREALEGARDSQGGIGEDYLQAGRPIFLKSATSNFRPPPSWKAENFAEPSAEVRGALGYAASVAPSDSVSNVGEKRERERLRGRMNAHWL